MRIIYPTFSLLAMLIFLSCSSTTKRTYTPQPQKTDLIYADESEYNTDGQKTIRRLRKEIEDYNFQYPLEKIESKFDFHPIARAAYLKGFITGYQWGLKGEQTSFPYHYENEMLEPPMMHGFFAGQYYGLQNKPPFPDKDTD